MRIFLLGTVWNVSKYRVFSGPYCPAFGLNTERYLVSLRIQSECGKVRTRKNSVFRYFTQWGFFYWFKNKTSTRKRFPVLRVKSHPIFCHKICWKEQPSIFCLRDESPYWIHVAKIRNNQGFVLTISHTE